MDFSNNKINIPKISKYIKCYKIKKRLLVSYIKLSLTHLFLPSPSLKPLLANSSIVWFPYVHWNQRWYFSFMIHYLLHSLLSLKKVRQGIWGSNIWQRLPLCFWTHHVKIKVGFHQDFCFHSMNTQLTSSLCCFFLPFPLFKPPTEDP